MKLGPLLAGIFLFVSLLLPLDDAQAAKVEDVFKGSVVLFLKPAPQIFPGPSAFVRFLKNNRKTHIWPDKKDKKDWRFKEWQFEFMAFFAKPLDDLEVTVKFFDITEGKKFVAADTFYTPSRGQRILASHLSLKKPRFAVNRKYSMIVLSAREDVLATTTFWLRGEKEHFSGQVTFTDDEAQGKEKKGGIKDKKD